MDPLSLEVPTLLLMAASIRSGIYSRKRRCTWGKDYGMLRGPFSLRESDSEVFRICGAGFQLYRYGSIKEKQRIPYFVMMMVATIAEFVSKLFGKVSRIQRFTVLMLMIDRWFDISAAERDLGYKPIKPTTEGKTTALQFGFLCLGCRGTMHISLSSILKRMSPAHSLARDAPVVQRARGLLDKKGPGSGRGREEEEN